MVDPVGPVGASATPPEEPTKTLQSNLSNALGNVLDDFRNLNSNTVDNEAYLQTIADHLKNLDAPSSQAANLPEG